MIVEGRKQEVCLKPLMHAFRLSSCIGGFWQCPSLHRPPGHFFYKMPGSLSQDLSIMPKYVAVLHGIRQKHTKPHPFYCTCRLQKNDFWKQNATAAGTTQIWLACQMADPISYLGSPNMWPHEAWIGRNGRMAGFARDNSPVRSGTLRGSVTGLKACAGLCSFA